MNIIDCIEVFVEVAKGLSFTKAAERLGTSRSVVTKKVAWLEQALETQLLQRNTKRACLTEAGQILLRNADSVARAITDLKDMVRSTAEHPAGRIRVGAPPSFAAEHLAPVLQSYLDLYPEVHITLQLDDGRSDLIAENMDLSIRIAPRLRDSSQIAYKIAVVPQVLVATQSYLDRAGHPTQPGDLKRHNCMLHTLKATTGSWQLTGGDGETHNVAVSGNFMSNLGESIMHLARRDYGISMHPRYMVDEFLASGQLTIVLPEYKCQGLDIYAVVQSKRYMPNKVQLLLDHLRSHFLNKDWASPDA